MLSYDEISWLRGNSPAWRLLSADNAPLVLSFLNQVFVAENARSISAGELASKLDDELYALNERLGDRTFPKTAKAYLDDWAAPGAGWLRKYYPEGSDEPHFDRPPPWTGLMPPTRSSIATWWRTSSGRPSGSSRKGSASPRSSRR